MTINNSGNRPLVYIGNNRALTKTIYGHKIIVDTRDLSLSPHILIDGYWESWITNVFLKLVKPGMNVVDIGCNVGFYSLLAAEKIGSSGNLICFEANPEMADLVFQNIQINGFGGRSKIINKAVYSENIPLTFNINKKFLGGSSLWADEAHVKNSEIQ
jgi:SAM-dependent methyltransferase